MKKMRLALPKGRLYTEVKRLLEDSGIRIKRTEREYRPNLSLQEIEAKILKPRNIAQLVSLGRFDCGFTGEDWLLEENSKAEILLRTGFDRVNVVVAAPDGTNLSVLKRKKRVIVATEYPNLAKKWLREKKIKSLLLRTYGATEVFPPEDADIIIDNTASGRTLALHNLSVLSTILSSETVLVASRDALRDPELSKRINELSLLLRSVLLARQKVLLEMNVPSEKMEEILPKLPCMKSPTVALLYGGAGYAVKIAIDEEEAAKLIPRLKEWGATDILQYRLERIVV
ncbi:MAG: ATP phosphoribosyltransferase [Planctomycetota bacterium]|nr:ATP phosphoribosyltransferase [Planctomycetota bacterium]